MTQLVLGVIGHVDHGKTALVRALTGQDTDRLAEEKRRGISIALGFAHLDVGPSTVIDLVDVPGHERFVRTMIAGATGMDAILLVVAANEGIKPQTLEHVDIAGLLGLRRAIVAVTKTDLASAAQAARVADDVVDMLQGAGMQPLPPVLTSAALGTGMAELRATLASLASEHHARSDDGVPFLPVDRAFTIPGHGPVVTGTLRGAAIAVGDTLELLPAQRRVRVRAVQVRGGAVNSAAPGQRVALNLRDVDSAELERGMALAPPGALEPSSWLTIAIRAVDSAPLLKNGMRLRALCGTNELDVRLRLLDRDVLAAGAAGFAQLHCAEPVAIPAGEHLVLRVPSPPRTVAGGRILEAETRRQRRNSVPVLQRLDRLLHLPVGDVLAAEVRGAGLAGASLQYLSRLTARLPSQVRVLLEPLPVVVTRGDVVVCAADLESLCGRISRLLAIQDNGLSLEQLLFAIPGCSGAVLEDALARLQASRTICKRGGLFSLARPAEDRARADAETALATRVAGLLQRAGLTPPTPKELLTEPRIKRAAGRLLREGVIVLAVDRAKGREILFHRDAIATARQQLLPRLEQEPGLLVQEIGALLGISRKYCVPLLNYLDEISFTLRVGDRRVLAPAARPVDTLVREHDSP